MIVSLADGADGLVAAVCLLLSFLTGLGPTPDDVFPADEPSPESTPSPPLTGKPQISGQHQQLLHYCSVLNTGFFFGRVFGKLAFLTLPKP